MNGIEVLPKVLDAFRDLRQQGIWIGRDRERKYWETEVQELKKKIASLKSKNSRLEIKIQRFQSVSYRDENDRDRIIEAQTHELNSLRFKLKKVVRNEHAT